MVKTNYFGLCYPRQVLWVLWHKKLPSWTKLLCQKLTLIVAFLMYLRMIQRLNMSCFWQDYSQTDHVSHFQTATTPPLELVLEPTSCIPLSLPMAFDFKRGRIAKIPWPDSMIKQPTDKVLMLEVACSCVPPCTEKKNCDMTLMRRSEDYGAMCFFSTQVDVQSIKWISCKGMYKGYHQVLLHEHSGDPTKQFCNVSSYFFRENLIMFCPT